MSSSFDATGAMASRSAFVDPVLGCNQVAVGKFGLPGRVGERERRRWRRIRRQHNGSSVRVGVGDDIAGSVLGIRDDGDGDESAVHPAASCG